MFCNILAFLLGLCTGPVNKGGQEEIVPRSDIDILTFYDWTDGRIVYHFQPYKAKPGAGMKRSGSAQFDRYDFKGYSLHEGDYGLCIEDHFDGPWLSVDPEEGSTYYGLAGCHVKLDSSIGALIFRDATSNQVVSVLSILPDKTDPDNLEAFKNYQENDLVEYLLAGKYKTIVCQDYPAGKTVEFQPGSFRVNGTLFGDTEFKLGYTNHSPAPVLIIKGRCYYVQQMDNTLTLYPVKYEDTNDCTRGKRNGAPIYLTCENNDEDFWPELSRRYLTETELFYYAGYNPEVPGENPNDLVELRKKAFATMRNYIFARHGYRFKNKEWQLTFVQYAWHKPQYDNVEDKLSDVERVNIELIRSIERMLNSHGQGDL